ncbi:odorant receptor 131-2-like [Dendropsophus ebraccatus]|uniref:odorant receptor 131-2-like n=1 Tax=Dendropsophus ebraccatus TaxID=150705 RepID=UPI00383227B8
MVNFTEISNNTAIQTITTVEILRTAVSVVMLLFFGIFVYFMVIVLNVFFTTPRIRETPRYILFIHMLLNDVIYLVISFFFFICVMNGLIFPLPICFIMVILSTCMFRITPYNLAVMSLERYTAICHPLRYAELSTAQRSSHAIAYMWMVGMFPQLAHFIAYCCFADLRTFNFKVICIWRSLIVSNVQVVMGNFADALSFSMVGIIIAYTYIKVTLVARRMDSEKFASKAGKTVLLHAFQLLLSMMSFTTTLTETYLISYFRYLPYINYFLVMSLPRFVSPLIYGMRDEVFGKAMRKFYLARRLSLCKKKSVMV